MNCPTCGRPTRLLSTEQLDNGCTKNTRTCTAPRPHAHGESVFVTYEVPAAVVVTWGPAAFEEAAKRAQRGFQRRAQAWARRDTVHRLAGTMPTASIAKTLGITEARVRQLASEPLR